MKHNNYDEDQLEDLDNYGLSDDTVDYIEQYERKQNKARNSKKATKSKKQKKNGYYY